MAKQKATVSLVLSSAVLSDACEWEQLCCCYQHQIWCCLSSQIYVVILASLKKKKNPLCVCYFSEQAKSVPSNSFPIPSLSLRPPSPPDYLSSHFFNLILSPVSSSAIPGDEMVHLSGFLSHDWEQQTRFFTCLPFS